MLTYYTLIFIVSLAGVFSRQTKRAYYLLFVFFGLVLISSLRGYTVGGDLMVYIPRFHTIAECSWNQLFTSYNKYGFIFQFIIKCSSVVSDDSTWYLFVLSIINLSIPILFIKRFSKIPWLSIFLYITLSYYTNTFNSLRSSMALSVGMMGMMYLLEDKKKWAFILFLIAFEIHKTILPIFLLFLLKEVKPTFWKLAIPIIASIVVANALGLAGFMNILTLYNEMNNYAADSNLEMGGKGYGMLIFDILLTFGCYFIARKNMTYLESVLIMTLCLATCLQAAAPLYSLVTRIAYFFTVYTVVLVPNVISRRFDKSSHRLVISGLMVLSLIYFKIFIMTPSNQYTFKSNSQLTIPYYFFWEKRPILT